MKNIFNGSPPMGRYGYAFPALAGLAALLLGVLIHASYPHLKPVLFSGENIRSGSFLLAGVYGKAITWDMPLYNTLASLWLNLGISPFYFLLASGAGMYLLVFFTAARLRGRKAGAAALALLVVFGLTSGRDIEQMFYSFFLMLSLALLLLRRRENTPANNVLAGLAIGASMLVRTPLFLLPPLVVGCDWLCGAGRGRGFLLRSAVFLAASYVLLLPWAAVRYPLTGKISLFDDRRAACNLITTARGGIYTIATDAYRLAPEYSGREMEYFFRQVKAAPGFYALTVIRRLGRIFLFNPLVFGVFLAALWAARRRGLLPDFLLPVYFVLIHSLFSVESRYLQPMACLAAPLAAAVLFPRPPDGDAGGGAFHAKAVRALFLLSFCAVLAVEALIIAYPLRAGGAFSPGSLQRALGQFPDDRVLQELRCDEHLAAGDYAGYYVCLDGYSRKFGDAAAGYFLRVRVSGRPAALPLPGGRDAQSYSIVRMLREFQLGDSRAALVSFGQAYALYEAENDTGRGAPYEKDKEIERVIKQDSNSFWDRYVYEALLKWPPGEIARILSEVEKHKGLTARLGLLKYAAGGPCNSGGLVSCLSGSDGIFEALVSESLLRRAAGLALLPARAGESRPAAAAYFRALSARSPKVPEYLLFGNGIAEAELYKMLELRGARQPGPAADRVREALRLRKRPVYYALAALYAPDNGGAELRASLDGLERELAADLPMLRSLYAAESAAGNAAPARRLALLAERLSAPEEKKKKEGIEKSRRLADAAVEKMRSGAYGAARQLLAEALLQNPENPEALMTSCSLFVLQGKKEKALEACRNVTAAVRSSPALGTPAFEALAGDAAWTSYKLLKELGRAAEAREVLRLAVEKAPAAWPGLAQARLALEADARAALKAAKE